jgi:tetraacyldisaccharide 4'-kinase
MLHFKKKIESIMNSEGKSLTPSLASLLHGISIFYGAAQRLRATCYRHRVIPCHELPCKVISIGNITVGGTGKTPMTIYVATEIKHAGFNVVIISRGYKGGAEKHGGIVSDGRTLYMDAEQAGDEPYMIACRLKGVPVVVGKNRFAAGMLAIEKFQPDVILLREPVSSLARSEACILTRYRVGADEALMSSVAKIQVLVPGVPVFTSSYVPYWYVVQKGAHNSFEAVPDVFSANDFEQIKYRKIFCFSGIARNDDFQHTVKDLGFKITGFLEFSDHHPYTEKDLATIFRCAGNTGADRLITTEKDYARIAFNEPLPMELIVVGVKVSFGDREQDFISFIKYRLQTE